MQVELFDHDGNNLNIKSSDLSIYKKSNVSINENTKEYVIEDESKALEYKLYGDKLSTQINVYTKLQTITKTLDNSTTYNTEINNTTAHLVALTETYNFVNLNDFNSDIKVSENTNNKIIVKTNELESTLDSYVFILNNEKLKNCYIKISFNKQLIMSNITLSNHKLVTMTYSLAPNLSIINNTITKEELEIETIKAKVTASDYSTTGNYTRPVSDYNDLSVNEENKTSTYAVENGTLIKSISDNGIVEKIDIDSTIKVKYTDKFHVIYENIIPSVNDEQTVNKGDTIGIITPETNLIFTNVFEDKKVLCEWMFDNEPEASVGANMTLMYQGDSRWGSNQYGTNSIAGGGCGPSSFSMVLSYIKGKNYTPNDVVSHMYEMGNGSFSWCYAPGEGSYHSIFERLAAEYDIGYGETEISKQSFIDELNQGHYIIICIKAGPIYRGSGHFIVIRDCTEDGQFYINDAAGFFDLNTAYSYSDLGPITTAKFFY